MKEVKECERVTHLPGSVDHVDVVHHFPGQRLELGSGPASRQDASHHQEGCLPHAMERRIKRTRVRVCVSKTGEERAREQRLSNSTCLDAVSTVACSVHTVNTKHLVSPATLVEPSTG